jgi:hypothetical protein
VQILLILFQPTKVVAAHYQLCGERNCAIGEILIIKPECRSGNCSGGTRRCHILLQLLWFAHIVDEHCESVGRVQDVGQVLLCGRQGLSCRIFSVSLKAMQCFASNAVLQVLPTTRKKMTIGTHCIRLLPHMQWLLQITAYNIPQSVKQSAHH